MTITNYSLKIISVDPMSGHFGIRILTAIFLTTFTVVLISY